MINIALKEKLESHKRWLESQIQRQEQDQRLKSSHSDDSQNYYSNDETDQQGDLGYYMVSVQKHESISNYAQNNQQHIGQKIMMRDEEDIINRQIAEDPAKEANTNSNNDSHSREVFKPLRSHNSRSEVKNTNKKSNSPNRDGSPGTKRWDILYMKNQKSIEKRKKLMNEKRAEDENDPECTFKPKINRKYPAESAASFIERSILWKQQKDQRLDDIRKQDENKDLRGCTFQPNLYETHKHRTVRNTQNIPPNFKGMDKFLRRYNIARQNKEEKELLLSNPMAKYKLEAAKKLDPTTAVSVTKHAHARKQSAQADLHEREENLMEPEYNRNNKNDIPFGYAIKQLHSELHSLNMKYEQF